MKKYIALLSDRGRQDILRLYMQQGLILNRFYTRVSSLVAINNNHRSGKLSGISGWNTGAGYDGEF